MGNKSKPNKIEALIWSIMLPGFGQLLNGQTTKGLVLLFLIILVNYKSKLNIVIIQTFNGNFVESIEVTDYQWLMFYPCLYMFALWDAYKEAEGEVGVLGYYPFIMAAYFLTVGLIFSSTLEVFGYLFGPVILPILFGVLAVFIGIWLRKYVLNIIKKTY